MEQRGFYEPAEQRGSDLRSDVTGRAATRLSSWSRIAATLAAHADLVPAQRECTSAS
ncbi:hypothetical protein MHY85_01210 [Cellulomonas sp. ACRRI]|uniref:hypothetical protein n=1 Tax=Cellulomonas sp. ACRRI TaxID=2918188 RepID=UPI001EF39152|nr:hypothetical protein [Cellulomonas sp. ACRRI]MCG7284588.1 hypothetical protein [Cellulomonas sp. ACRRI]